MDDFLKALEEVEDELTAPDPEKTVDPSEATAGEYIEAVLQSFGDLERGLHQTLFW